MSFTITYLQLKQQIDQSPALELLEPDPASGGWSLQPCFYGEHGWCREGSGGHLALVTGKLRLKSKVL